MKVLKIISEAYYQGILDATDRFPEVTYGEMGGEVISQEVIEVDSIPECEASDYYTNSQGWLTKKFTNYYDLLPEPVEIDLSMDSDIPF